MIARRRLPMAAQHEAVQRKDAHSMITGVADEEIAGADADAMRLASTVSAPALAAETGNSLETAFARIEAFQLRIVRHRAGRCCRPALAPRSRARSGRRSYRSLPSANVAFPARSASVERLVAAAVVRCCSSCAARQPTRPLSSHEVGSCGGCGIGGSNSWRGSSDCSTPQSCSAPEFAGRSSRAVRLR